MQENKKIVIIGGAGYVGSALTLDLLNLGYSVSIIDNFTYGNPFPYQIPKLTLIKADVRDVPSFSKYLDNSFGIIHLACISNDPSFDLDPKIGKSVNLDCFLPLLKSIRNLNVERFIYASSSSVYGIKDEEKVTEDLSLEPLTDYSLYKVECEKILLNEEMGDVCKTIIRPATVCGPSARQRLDVVVNLLTAYAYFNKKITVLGGAQSRPNVHINDMCGAYCHMLKTDKFKISDNTFNVGFENITVDELSKLVKESMPHDIIVETKPTNDPRSYRIDSHKIINETGFTPKFNIENAIKHLITSFDLGHCSDALINPIYKNIDVLKQKGFGS
ncbi:SDR family oxidoreductase [Amylibacter sp.]|jgi:nucleoside-diphosphate-sugar epimerase|nr:SDR family oxidoreductase [Amylibacter sp.]